MAWDAAKSRSVIGIVRPVLDTRQIPLALTTINAVSELMFANCRRWASPRSFCGSRVRSDSFP